MTAPTLPTAFHVAAWGLSFLALALAARHLSWFKLRGDSEAQHVLFAAILAVCVLRFAVLYPRPASALPRCGHRLPDVRHGVCAVGNGFRLAGRSAVDGRRVAGTRPGLPCLRADPGAMPALRARAGGAASARPGNPFVYVFLIAFFGAGAAVLVGQLFKAAVAAGLVDGAARDAAMGYLVSAPLMVFGEAFLTGSALALMVA